VDELATACAGVLERPPGTGAVTLLTEDEAAGGWAKLYRSVAFPG
jgi:hypothetical protein